MLFCEVGAWAGGEGQGVEAQLEELSSRNTDVLRQSAYRKEAYVCFRAANQSLQAIHDSAPLESCMSPQLA